VAQVVHANIAQPGFAAKIDRLVMHLVGLQVPDVRQ
jgi:hypothetical protein